MSEQPCEPRFQKLIDGAFVGDLAPDRWRELSTHLAGCEKCRAYHDRLGLIDEALGSAPLSSVMRDRIAEQVIASVGDGGRRNRRSIGTWSYGVAAAAVVLVAVILPFIDRGNDEFVARGSETQWAVRPPGIGLFCITPPTKKEGRALVDRAIQAVRPGQRLPVLPCRLDQELQIAYSTPARGSLFMIVQGETAGDPHWYVPRSPGEGAYPLDVDAIGRALGWSTRLGLHHEVGTIKIVARFYRSPDGEETVDALEALLEVRPER